MPDSHFKHIIFVLLSAFAFPQEANLKKEIDSLLILANATGDSIQQKAIEVSEQAYLKSKAINYAEGILKSRMLSSRNNYDLGKFKETLFFAAELEKEAKKNRRPEYISEAHRLKAMAYTELGFFRESELEINKGLFTADEISDQNLKELRKGFLYETKSFNLDRNNKPLDSVILYHNLALDAFKRIDNNTGNRNFCLSLVYSNLGLCYARNGNLKLGEDYLLKSMELSKSGSSQVRSFAFLELGNLYKDQKEYTKAIEYYEKGILLSSKINQPYTLRNLYQGISDAYSEQGKIDHALKYLRKYTYLNDSLLLVEKKSIEAPIQTMISEKEEEHEIFVNRLFILILTAAVIVLIIFSILIIHNRKNNRKYKQLIENLTEAKNNKSTDSTPLKEGFTILESTEIDILKRLQQFEKSKKFLKRETNLSYMAVELHTNTKYLSDIIKKHKGKNFNNYLNGLRIAYITKKIYEDKIYCDYKTSYLAEECGFSTRELFARIFKQETGVSPSFFINEARKKHQNEN